ncbi:DNA-directed DNA polymerase [Tanacetum coccineum]
MCIELANRSTQYRKGIANNVILQIDKFVFPIDFAILDMEEDSRVLIILGRAFLATAHAMIDVFTWENIFRNLPIHDHVQEDLCKDQIDSFLLRPVEGYEPCNGEIRSVTLWDEEKTVLELSYGVDLGHQLCRSREKVLLLEVLAKHKTALAWKVVDIKGITPSFCTYKILMEDVVRPQ